MSGDPLESEDRSDEAEWIECSCRKPLTQVLSDKRINLPRGEGGGLGKSRSANTYIFLGQQVGAELQVIVQVEGATGLEASAEGRHGRSLGQLPHALHTAELALGVLGSHLGGAAGATVVII